MDVTNVFLHGDLDEEAFMRLPLVFSSSSPHKVCRLRNHLMDYGKHHDNGSPSFPLPLLLMALLDHVLITHCLHTKKARCL